MSDSLIWISIVALILASGLYTWSEYTQCYEKGGVLVRGFSGYICAKEII